jgi:cation diffusion facilitator family transporter
MNTDNKIEKLKPGQKIAFISAFITLILAILKGTIGSLFNSKILIADAFHSSTDLFAILISGFGLWLASKKKSDKFPYGLFKAETLATFIIGLLVIWIGIELLKTGYNKLFHIEKIISFPFMPILASIISIITSFFISKKIYKVGENINSSALIINA